jgi:hypothetical protein
MPHTRPRLAQALIDVASPACDLVRRKAGGLSGLTDEADLALEDEGEMARRQDADHAWRFLP